MSYKSIIVLVDNIRQSQEQINSQNNSYLHSFIFKKFIFGIVNLQNVYRVSYKNRF